MVRGTKNFRQVDLWVWLSFFAVYFIWGSTYLALSIALKTMPPFIMAATRFLIAGSFMLTYGILTQAVRPTKKEVKNSFFVGILLLVIGNGGVVFAEQFLDSGYTSLVVTIEPVWVVLLLWIFNKNNKPVLSEWLGVMIGMVGIIYLVQPNSIHLDKTIHYVALLFLIVSSISWALGSVLGKNLTMPSSSILNVGLQMIFASIGFMLLSFVYDDWENFHVHAISLESYLGLGYLIVFGSLIGFNAYNYLVRHTNPTLVSTYAFVNPIVAVALGAILNHEKIAAHTLLAGFILIIAVVCITLKFDVAILRKIKMQLTEKVLIFLKSINSYH